MENTWATYMGFQSSQDNPKCGYDASALLEHHLVSAQHFVAAFHVNYDDLLLRLGYIAPNALVRAFGGTLDIVDEDEFSSRLESELPELRDLWLARGSSVMKTTPPVYRIADMGNAGSVFFWQFGIQKSYSVGYHIRPQGEAESEEQWQTVVYAPRVPNMANMVSSLMSDSIQEYCFSNATEIYPNMPKMLLGQGIQRIFEKRTYKASHAICGELHHLMGHDSDDEEDKVELDDGMLRRMTIYERAIMNEDYSNQQIHYRPSYPSHAEKGRSLHDSLTLLLGEDAPDIPVDDRLALDGALSEYDTTRMLAISFTLSRFASRLLECDRGCFSTKKARFIPWTDDQGEIDAEPDTFEELRHNFVEAGYANMFSAVLAGVPIEDVLA